MLPYMQNANESVSISLPALFQILWITFMFYVNDIKLSYMFHINRLHIRRVNTIHW